MHSALNTMVRTLRRDIEEIQTKTKEAEKEARAAEEALDQLEKTRRESLLQASKHIESMRKLSMAVSHQLRNPATVIGGLARLMLKRSEGREKHDEYLQGIICAAERIEKIIQVVKEHNSIIPCEMKEVALSDLVTEVQDFSDRKAAELSKTIDWTLEIQPLRLSVDVQLMIRALSEISFNAIESFTGERGSIRIAASESEGFLIMQFTDNGRGIPESDLAFIFDPFFTTKAVGVGAGLPLANRIIQEHHGTVNVESECLAGTKVTIRLPITCAKPFHTDFAHVSRS
jgi:methyl-accepting chemotaxis protein